MSKTPWCPLPHRKLINFDLSHSGSLSLSLNLMHLHHHHCPLGLFSLHTCLALCSHRLLFAPVLYPTVEQKSPVVSVHSPIGGHFGYHQSLAIFIKATYTHSCTFLSEHYFMHEHYFYGNKGGIIDS